MKTRDNPSAGLGEFPGIQAGFLRSCDLFPGRPAVEVAGETLSYAELRRYALSLAATVQHAAPPCGPPLTGVFADRSPTAFAGVIGSLLAGHGYVPLNPTFPPDRTRTMLLKSGCRSIIVDSTAAAHLDQVLQGIDRRLLLILPDESSETLAERWPNHLVLGSRDLESPNAWREARISEDSIAYLLFTSGSTGIPKGVMVTHRNVSHFVETMVRRYEITSQDRFSQTFDMTFDLSAFDMFVAWERGACVCCPPRKTLLNPGRFIQESQLTIWFSVPSVGFFMKQLGALKRGRYPSLRLSLFCGEPLPAEFAEAWAEAAPNSILENLYGPTELTIACCLYRWDSRTSPQECERGLVPIGYPYPMMSALVVDNDLGEVKAGAEGELLMAGPQVTLGYWREPQKTSSKYVNPPGKAERYYRTGDLVRKPLGDGPLTYLGRVDNQVKVQGHRVELEEVEAHLREAAGVDIAVAVGWPLSLAGTAGGVVAFLADDRVNLGALRDSLKNKLPSYAMPRDIRFLAALPLNSNGKVDRAALVRMLAGTT